MHPACRKGDARWQVSWLTAQTLILTFPDSPELSAYPVAFEDVLAAYSCGGSRGLDVKHTLPRSLFAHGANRVTNKCREPNTGRSCASTNKIAGETVRSVRKANVTQKKTTTEEPIARAARENTGTVRPLHAVRRSIVRRRWGLCLISQHE